MVKTKKIGQILLEANAITNDQLDDAIKHQAAGEKIGETLIRLGHVSENDFHRHLSESTGIQRIDLKSERVEKSLVAMITREQAAKLKALPIRENEESIIIGMVDPMDIIAINKLEKIMGKHVTTMLITPSDMLMALDHYFNRSSNILQLSKTLVDELDLDNHDSPTVNTKPNSTINRIVDSIVMDALDMEASDIHIEPFGKKSYIRFRVDGVLDDYVTIQNSVCEAIVSHFKILSGIDITEKRLPQDGKAKLKTSSHAIEARISTLPVPLGESLVIRILGSTDDLIKVDNLGMPQIIHDNFLSSLKKNQGIILVTGPTGSGKTTTLYAAMSEISGPFKKIITIEDPIEYSLEYMTQVQINEKINLSYKEVLKSVLRQDPDSVLIGEMRDPETSSAAIRASMTGHLVLSTLHTNDAIASIHRLIDMGVPPYLISESLEGIVAQRLVRKTCPHCQENLSFDPALYSELARINILAENLKEHYMHGTGCAHCHFTGYTGRIGMFEYLQNNDSIKPLIKDNQTYKIKSEAIKTEALHTFSNSAIELINEGIVSPIEILRILR